MIFELNHLVRNYYSVLRVHPQEHFTLIMYLFLNCSRVFKLLRSQPATLLEKAKMLQQQETGRHERVSGAVVGWIRCQSSTGTRQHLPQTHSGSAAFTHNDIQGTCGSSAAIGEKRREKASLTSSNSEWGREKRVREREEDKRLWS